MNLTCPDWKPDSSIALDVVRAKYPWRELATSTWICCEIQRRANRALPFDSRNAPGTRIRLRPPTYSRCPMGWSECKLERVLLTTRGEILLLVRCDQNIPGRL